MSRPPKSPWDALDDHLRMKLYLVEVLVHSAGSAKSVLKGQYFIRAPSLEQAKIEGAERARLEFKAASKEPTGEVQVKAVWIENPRSLLKKLKSD